MADTSALMATDVLSWLRMSDAARRLKVTDTMVHKLIAAGRLDAIRTPYGRLVDPKSVERLAAEREARKKSRRQGT